MSVLIKIRDLSSKYDISARTLRYYEDIGLISSTRSDDYAYRLYDEDAVKRLEQILILRKLNISIKDIKLVFSASSSDVVLDVLGKKVTDIDNELALLHELKEIVLDFIHQIRNADFQKDSDVRLLYDKAKVIETQLENADYRGNPSSVKRFLDVTEQLKKDPEVRIVKINPFRAFSSGLATTDVLMGAFNAWQQAHNHLVKRLIYGAPDFLGYDDDARGEWIWAIEDWVTEQDTAPYQIVNFEGGLYAAAISMDNDNESGERVYNSIRRWIDSSGFELDEGPGREGPGRRTVFHMLNPIEEINQALGYQQLDIYVPIRIPDTGELLL